MAQKDLGHKDTPGQTGDARTSLLGDVLVPIDKTLQELTPEELRAVVGGDGNGTGKTSPDRCWRFED